MCKYICNAINTFIRPHVLDSHNRSYIQIAETFEHIMGGPERVAEIREIATKLNPPEDKTKLEADAAARTQAMQVYIYTYVCMYVCMYVVRICMRQS